ncbi:hypothetical protein ABZ990_03430 [Streptomyces sp. NPDC046203]|uniref:hypothetical protein n=1 Tax=Streptomyces sp. NPDC046203 TaxID=3154602 RepID=UPI0033CFF277
MPYRIVVTDHLPARLEGTFSPWAVEYGHSKVLLRGFLARDDERPPRVFDVLFQDVSRISLSDYYRDGLGLADAGPDALRAEGRRIGRAWSPGDRLFRLSAGHPYDYVVAGYVFWAEVLVPATAPSPLMQESPPPGAVEGGAIFRLRTPR